jgi:hypothetical protein
MAPELEGSSLHSQQPANDPEPGESTPHTPIWKNDNIS